MYNALNKAQEIYIRDYGVDITKIYSTSTLSLTIFRLLFQKIPIPVMKKKTDYFVRQAYYGGAVDHYKFYGQDIFSYDVNSLYPNSMCKDLPGTIIREYSDMSNVKLENFFGFILAEVYCPKTMWRPCLPVRLGNSIIFPTGRWKGVYFSEEMKVFAKLGYQFKLFSGIEYTRERYYDDYVDHFYLMKENAEGTERFIAKMHLNQLYGYFGRNLDLLETIIIPKKDLPKYVSTRIIKRVINISDNMVV